MELKSQFDSIDKYTKDEKRSQLKNILEDLTELIKDDLFDIDTRKQLLDLLRELNCKQTNSDHLKVRTVCLND